MVVNYLFKTMHLFASLYIFFKQSNSSMFTPISELKDHVGKIVTVRGWVYRSRSGKAMAFIVMRDSTGVVQCIFPAASPYYKTADSLLIESSCSVTGKVKKDDRAPGGFEIEGSALEVYQKAIEFTDKIFNITLRFRKEIQYSLGDQFRRASLSICNNLAEGSDKQTVNSKVQFYVFALDSARECVPMLTLSLKQKQIRSMLRSC